MHRDPLAGLLKRGFVVDLPQGFPCGEAALFAVQLAERGLLRLAHREYVRCVNPLDHDQHVLKDHTCSGKIILAPDRDEDDGETSYDFNMAILEIDLPEANGTA